MSNSLYEWECLWIRAAAQMLLASNWVWLSSQNKTSATTHNNVLFGLDTFGVWNCQVFSGSYMRSILGEDNYRNNHYIAIENSYGSCIILNAFKSNPICSCMQASTLFCSISRLRIWLISVENKKTVKVVLACDFQGPFLMCYVQLLMLASRACCRETYERSWKTSMTEKVLWGLRGVGRRVNYCYPTKQWVNNL